jgi:hypothetical protein
MSNLKIERSATTGQSNLAKVSGRNLSIQDNNVHANQGKNVACPIGQPVISYKEMLRKEPLKVSSESDEMTLSVKDVTTYWLNASPEPKKRITTSRKK